jgi:parvulin-like peptidyl-prolyl isomerase
MDAALGLAQPGDFAPVIETPTAFYLVRLMERRPASLRPLAEVRAGIEYLVGREKEQAQSEARYRELRQAVDIRINEPLLESFGLAVPRPPPPPMSADSTVRAGDPAVR